MHSPFFIKHKTNLDYKYNSIENRIILEEFEYRFNKSYADHIDIHGDSKLSVRNDVIRFAPDMNFNFWTGIGKAEIEISKDLPESRTITYTYYFTRIIISYTILWSFLIISTIFMNFEVGLILTIIRMFIPFYTLFFFVVFLIILVRHKTVFNKVIRNIKNRIY